MTSAKQCAAGKATASSTSPNTFPIPSLMDITSRPALIFTEGKGSWLYDSTGRKYLDFVQGWAVNALGHAPQLVTDALAKQSAKLLTPSPAFYNEPAIALSQGLTHGTCFKEVFFTNSGAEANEGAIKLARKWGRLHKNKAYEIITTVGGFHGRTLAMMSASGKPGWDEMFAPQVPGFPKAEFNNLASFEALINDRSVALMVEPVQGEGGVNCATPEFLKGLRALADKHKLLLIFDEVQTGMGRLGTLFGYQHFGVEPDIMTLGKGIGAGVPLGAVLAKEAACVFEHGDQGGTYCGNPLCCAVGVAVLAEIARPEFLTHVRSMAQYLSQGLTKLSLELNLGPERGIGLLRALELNANIGAQVVDIARDNGLLLNSPRPSVLRFMPALNVTADEIDEMLHGLRHAVNRARAHE